VIYEDPNLYERQTLPKKFYTRTLDAIIEKYRVRSAVDFGCGLGVDVAMLLDAGLDVFGIDGSEKMREHVLFPKERYRVADLTQHVVMVADLVWCREVAEHLPPDYAGALVANIIGNGRVAYFTAAPPGQPGYRHVNPQERGYWLDLFSRYGWKLDAELTVLNGEHPNEDDARNGMVLCPEL